MFFEILFVVFVFLYVAIWIHRCMILDDFYRIARNTNGDYIYDKGYDLTFGLLCSDSEKTIEDLKNRSQNKKILGIHLILSFVLLPLTFLMAKTGISKDICYVILSIWCIACIFVECIWEKLLIALEDRAYLVLRQSEENKILNMKDESDKHIISTIRTKRNRHEQKYY